MGGVFGLLAMCDLHYVADEGVLPFQQCDWELYFRKSSPGEY